MAEQLMSLQLMEMQMVLVNLAWVCDGQAYEEVEMEVEVEVEVEREFDH